MKKYDTDKIRNIMLAGHQSVGKTMLGEAILFNAGITNRMGRIEDGNTVFDAFPDEIERQISIVAALASFEHGLEGYRIADELKGQVPMGLVVLKAGSTKDPEQLVAELRLMVREQIGAVASFRRAHVVKRLPKTRSGKILRRCISNIADGETFSVPSTIDDPAVLDELRATIPAATV